MNKVLSHDHKEIDVLLANLFNTMKTGDAEAVFTALDIFWARLAMHIRAEHLHLFPAVLAGADGTQVTKTVEELRADHDHFMHELADAVKTMRGILKTPAAAVPAEMKRMIGGMALRLARHNQIEESKIYPLAAGSLSVEECDELEASIKQELDNFPKRFKQDGGDNITAGVKRNGELF